MDFNKMRTVCRPIRIVLWSALIGYGIYPQISTIELMVILVSSERWYNDHKDIYDDLYPRLEKAIASSKRGVRINWFSLCFK